LWRVGRICPQQLAAGGGCVDGGLGLEQALWCDTLFFATPPFPSRPCLLLWAGRQPCDGEEQRIWLLSGDVWCRHMGSGGPGGICGGAHASGFGVSQRLLPGLVYGRCGAWCCRCSAGTVGPAGGGGGPRCFATVVATGTSLALWIGLCGLVGRRRLWRCALSRGPGRTLCWGFSWAKALATTTLLGAASPVEGVVLPSFVFRGRKPDPPRTDDDGVLDVTPFLKASLLKFVSATSRLRWLLSSFGSRFACGGGGLHREIEAATSGDVAWQR
jgi:hypothetical protein